MSPPSSSMPDPIVDHNPVGDGGRASTPGARVTALSLLYTAQGVPFGIAAEYLPVVLRMAHYSMGQIGLAGLLQAPWQAKVLWSHAADGPAGQRHGRVILLGLQLTLAALMALFALSPFASAPTLWFALTALCALAAATQDVFVDALAVRTLGPAERGLGNTAQVAGYRVGMLAGGAGLLLAAGRIGERAAVLACAALVAVTSAAAFALRGDGGANEPRTVETHPDPGAPSRILPSPASLPLGALLRRMVSSKAWPVLALALTYKLGLHMAGVLIKPMAVDARWTQDQIALAVATVGIGMAILGAVCGGLLHGRVTEKTALVLGAVFQALVCVPLVVTSRLGAPLGWTTAAIAFEHFATGLGTTVLFAALMSATRAANAGRHYTILTSANVACSFLGSTTGGFLADHQGRTLVFALAGLVSLVPLAFLARWNEAARESAAD